MIYIPATHCGPLTISRNQNNHGSVVRTGFYCRKLLDVLTISTRVAIGNDIYTKMMLLLTNRYKNYLTLKIECLSQGTFY